MRGMVFSVSAMFFAVIVEIWAFLPARMASVLLMLSCSLSHPVANIVMSCETV